MWQRTWMIMWKEFIHIRRDPRLLIVVFGMPIFMLLLYGYAINLDIKHVRMGVYDQDQSPASRDLVAEFAHNDYLDIVAYPESPAAVDALLDHGRAKVIIVIPVTYSRDLARSRTAQVQVLVDGSDSTSASTAIGYVNSVLQQHGIRLKVAALQRAGVPTDGVAQSIDHRVRFWYNPELKSSHFIVPGLIAMLLMMLSTLLASVTVVRERERGTIEPLIVSPIRPIELMAGKLIPYVMVAFADVILVLTAGVLVFHVPMAGSPWLVLTLSMVFLIAVLGIGLFISTIAPSQQVAMGGALMFSQLPTVILSGFIFPISSMPPPIQVITNIIPAAHFIKILRAIVLKGSDLSLVWQPALLLLIIGVGMLTLSALRFRKKL